MRSHVYVLSITILLNWLSSPAKSEIVFDSITDTTQLGGGIVTLAGYHGGDIVRLAGDSRVATRLDVLLKEFGVSGDLTFRVNLWEPSGVPDDPGSLLWTSPVHHASLLSRTSTVFSIEVPGVHVPDTLGWTVESISNLHSAGVASAFPATVGTITGHMLFNTHEWDVIYFAPSTGGYGFRLFAVPEPETCVLLVVAAAALFFIVNSHAKRAQSIS